MLEQISLSQLLSKLSQKQLLIETLTSAELRIIIQHFLPDEPPLQPFTRGYLSELCYKFWERGNLFFPKEHTAALQCYNLVLELDPHCVPALHARGNTLIISGNYFEAYESGKAIIKIDPENIGAREVQSKVLNQLGQYHIAQKYTEMFQKFSGEKNAQIINFFTEAANIHEIKRGWGKDKLAAFKGKLFECSAREELSIDIILYEITQFLSNPLDIDNEFLIYVVEQIQKNPELLCYVAWRLPEAERQKNISQLQPNEFLNTLKKVYPSKTIPVHFTPKKEDESEEKLSIEPLSNPLNIQEAEKQIKQYSAEIAALLSKAQAFSDRYDQTQALSAYEEVLEKDPDNILALMYIAEASPEKALFCYDKVLSIDPSLQQAHIKRGDILYDMNLYFEAHENYKAALKIGLVGYVFTNTTQKKERTACSMGHCNCHNPNSYAIESVHKQPSQQKWQDILKELITTTSFLIANNPQEEEIKSTLLQTLKSLLNTPPYNPDSILWSIINLLRKRKAKGINVNTFFFMIFWKIQHIPELKYIVMSHANHKEKERFMGLKNFINLLAEVYSSDRVLGRVEKRASSETDDLLNAKAIIINLYQAVKDYKAQPPSWNQGKAGKERANRLIEELVSIGMAPNLDTHLVLYRIRAFLKKKENDGPTLNSYIYTTLKNSKYFITCLKKNLLEQGHYRNKSLHDIDKIFANIDSSAFFNMLNILDQKQSQAPEHKEEQALAPAVFTAETFTPFDKIEESSSKSGGKTSVQFFQPPLEHKAEPTAQKQNVKSPEDPSKTVGKSFSLNG